VEKQAVPRVVTVVAGPSTRKVAFASPTAASARSGAGTWWTTLPHAGARFASLWAVDMSVVVGTLVVGYTPHIHE
jgi:hypothetical protein